MAEFAAAALQTIGTALSAVFSTGGEAAAGAAGAATTAASAAASTGLSSLFSASTLGSILSGGATILSATAALSAAKTQQQSFENAALDTLDEIPNEEIKGMERRSTIRDELLKTIGEQHVAYAASGLDLSFGTPAVAQDQADEEAQKALSLDQGTEDYNVARLKRRAALYRMQGIEAKRGGLAKATGLVIGGAADILNRG